MNRYEFLKSLGLTGAALMAALASCVRDEDSVVNALTLNPPQTGTPTSTTAPASTTTTAGNGTDLSAIKNRLLTIDLTSQAAASLKKVGGYLAQSSIVVAQVSAGVYVAVTQICSHEPKRQVIFNVNEFYCTAHGARFDLTGKGKNSFGSRGITVYKVATDGVTLVVYS